MALLLALTCSAFAQDTTTQQPASTQSGGEAWSVVQFPVGQEVVVELQPTTASSAPAPRVKVMHTPDGTVIAVDPASFAGTSGDLNLYAVDQTGSATNLGPISKSGSTPQTFKTNMDKFMLVASPDANMTSYTPATSVAYRSSVPTGLTVIPIAREGRGPGAPRGEKVAAAAAPANPYSVPMLGVPSLPVKKETEVKVTFPNMTPAPRANIFVTPNFNNTGATRVKAKLHELSAAPVDAFVTLWAVSPEGKFWRIGSVRNAGKPNVATIDSDELRTNVPFKDFGLFFTIEPTENPTAPTGTVFGTVSQ